MSLCNCFQAPLSFCIVFGWLQSNESFWHGSSELIFFICLQTFMNGVNSLEFDAAHVTYTFRERHFELFTRAPRKSRQKNHAISCGNLRPLFTNLKFGNYWLPSSELQCALFNIRSLIDKASELNDIITDTNLDMHFLRDLAGAQWLTQFKLDYSWIHVF